MSRAQWVHAGPEEAHADLDGLRLHITGITWELQAESGAVLARGTLKAFYAKERFSLRCAAASFEANQCLLSWARRLPAAGG